MAARAGAGAKQMEGRIGRDLILAINKEATADQATSSVAAGAPSGLPARLK